MSARRQELGRGGERIATELLLASGYRVLARNLRLPGGEIDVLCLDGSTLVVVEVKRRESSGYGRALAAVGRSKRATLRRIAADYAQIVAPRAQIRFDVVAIDGERVTLHRNAF
ncbi:MAG TPA: YraN family protein [Candidatus Dormibacteraeota bacterium]|nr:YraN family protein [Candidatus Dormibacteraeota bacterium]